MEKLSACNCEHVCVVLYNLEMLCVSFQDPALPWMFRSVCVFVKSPEAGHGACLIKSSVYRVFHRY